MSTVQSTQYQAFLERLRAARGKAGLTQAEVAKKLGRPQSFVSKSESGERRVDVLELAQFSQLYQVPLDFFLKPTTGRPRRSATA